MIELTTTSATATVTVHGDLDVAERDQFGEVTRRVGEQCWSGLVVDLCAAEFLDATGAGFLVGLAQIASARDVVALLRGADDRSLFVLDLIGALPLFAVDEQHFCVGPAADGDSVLDGAGLEVPFVPAVAVDRREPAGRRRG